MKKYIYIVVSLFMACTDVVDVDVPTAEPRLVIEASLDWEKGTIGQNQTIKLSTTRSFYDLESPNAVTGATVTVTRESDGEIYNFADNNNGNYTINTFDPVFNEAYTLEVIYEGESYTATETLLPTTPITKVTQSRDNGFLPDALEVNVFFKDPADETNFYLLKFKDRDDYFPYLLDVSDEFLNGNEVQLFYEKSGDDEDDEFQPGDIVDINLYNISERYYNYIRLLISQTSSDNPFAPVPVEIRGNIINNTNSDNYPYGYFRITETDFKTHVFVADN
ncbi:DUF4249 domain-containing protein [Gaetbulibacter saemankumensis]|uniref:DUF4249 domain-containing protein n=1 Tax=Gaetbulibacter saemankumensis TaxID=311208 RepID=UPI000429C7FF|nr:DUF4249 domain-containing protein [Gaetbulibacter saemankumensis]